MLYTYLQSAFRNTFKNCLVSLVNILGLAAGLASFILILLFLQHELSYDHWDESLNRVYRLSLKQDDHVTSNIQAPMARLLQEQYPQTAAVTAIQAAGDFEMLLTANGKSIYQKGIIAADSSFFQVFPYPFAQGSASNALAKPNEAMLSARLSEKLFGKEDPMGKPIRLFIMRNLTIALVVVIPVSWWAGNQWLQQFAYRTELNWTVFAAGFGILMLLSVITISLQAVKAATANPVKNLRNE
jgi:putative ABC transport system permease protein